MKLLWPFLSFILLIIIGSLFRIDTINCKIADKNCDAELYEKLDILKKKSLFFVNLDDQYLLESYQKKFPSTIILNFNTEKALYQLNFEEQHLFITEAGNILKNNSQNNKLIQVNYNNSAYQDKHSKIIKIIKEVGKNELEINSITWLNNKEIIINISDNPKIIIDEEAINTRVPMIDLLLSSQKIQDYEEPIKEIDLRFNLPVLRTTQ